MFENWAGIALGVFGVVGILGGASAYFSSSRAKSIIDLQKEELDVTKESNERLKGERDNLLTRVGNLEGQLATLTTLVTQRPQIDKLAQDTLVQHREVIAQLKGIAELLSKQASK